MIPACKYTLQFGCGTMSYDVGEELDSYNSKRTTERDGGEGGINGIH